MKILQVISTFYPAFSFGGPAKAAYEISKGLARKGHDVEVFTTNAYDQTRNFDPKLKKQTLDNFEVNYFNNLLRSGNIFVSYEIVAALRKKLRAFDIVHTHFGRQIHDVVAGYYGLKHGIPYVLQPRGDLPRIMSKQRLKLIYDSFFGHNLLRNASKVIALSQTETEQFRDIGVSESKIAVIPNGVDLSEYANLPSKGLFRKKFSLEKDEKIVLYVGRIHRIKGIDILLKAFANATRFNDAKLAIVGPDDGYLSNCRDIVKQLDIENRILFTGALFGSNKLEAYVDSNVLVLPSTYEIFGNVILESYACSKPVIASRVGGLQELVFQDETGLLFKPGAVKELSAAISTLLGNDEICASMGLRARKVVEEKFSLEKTIEMLETTYEAILRR
jgi:glycosyltransferase involved in cell wall biosynthesis